MCQHLFSYFKSDSIWNVSFAKSLRLIFFFFWSVYLRKAFGVVGIFLQIQEATTTTAATTTMYTTEKVPNSMKNFWYFYYTFQHSIKLTVIWIIKTNTKHGIIYLIIYNVYSTRSKFEYFFFCWWQRKFVKHAKQTFTHKLPKLMNKIKSLESSM